MPATWQGPLVRVLQGSGRRLPRLGWARPGYLARLARVPLPCSELLSCPSLQPPIKDTPSRLAPGHSCASPHPSLPLLLCPWGSNRSSRGQNTISFNKLNLLRLLITSGVGSDQRGGYSPGGPCGGGREGEIHVEGVESLAGPGDPSHSNRNSGQVSILLDKNRKEGALPTPSSGSARNPPSLRKSRSL